MHIRDILSAGRSSSETEVLLAALLKKKRTWLLTHPEYTLTEREKNTWDVWQKRRLNGEPIDYIRGEREFFGRPFLTDRRALIPRPATEGLVSMALAWLHEPMDSIVPTDAGIVAMARTLKNVSPISTVIDVGTGSGCIAVTLALERPDLNIIATDVSEEALTLARKNAKQHGVSSRIEFRRGSLLEPVKDLLESFLLVSNPPYVPSGRILPSDITEFEPNLALFAGEDGMAVIRPLVTQAQQHPFCCGFIVECEYEQAKIIQNLIVG